MNDLIVSQKLSIDADLSQAAFEDALEDLKIYMDEPRKIICGQENSLIAGRLAQAHNLQVIILPCLVIKQDSWVIIGSCHSIFSPGA